MTYAVALAAVVIPILFAIHIAKEQSVSNEKKHMLAYAMDVLHRSNVTASQIAAGIDKLLAEHSPNPCSDRSIGIMREIDIGSSYIQAIGYVSGNRMICSSIGLNELELDLGTASLTTSNGVVIRLNARLPFANGDVLIVERNSYAAIVHKDLPIDATTAESEVSLATFAIDTGAVLASRGYINPEWTNRLKGNSKATFIDGNHLVAVVGSEKYRIGAISALPVSIIEQRTLNSALWITPVGLIAGLILAFAVFRLAVLQQSMSTALKGALKRKEFFLVYQPVVDLRTGGWVGVEALVRWKMQSGKIIPPDLFIPVAESTGLIQRITEQIIGIVAKDAAQLFSRYPGFHIAINLSAADLHSVHTVELLHQLKQSTSAGPANLIVEATEREFLSIDTARDTVHNIRAMGIRTSIDDFGTGYSSLSYLEKLEIDFLKIDKSFVDTIETDAPTSHVVLHIIELAKDLKLEIIAEGVEANEQALFLRDRGVHYAQGWLFGKPMPFSELESELPVHFLK